MNHLLIAMMLELCAIIIRHSEALQCSTNSYLCSCAALRRGLGTAAVGTVAQTLSHLLLSWPSPASLDQSTMNPCAFKHIHHKTYQSADCRYIWPTFTYLLLPNTCTYNRPGHITEQTQVSLAPD